LAFNVFFKTVENPKELQIKGTPWRCDKCHKDPEVLLKITIDYDTLVLCKKCMLGAKTLITDKEKELKNGKNRKNSSNDKTRRSGEGPRRKNNK
jgi:transposase-like protein